MEPSNRPHSDLVLDVGALASARRRSGFEPLPAGDGWTACPAPKRMAVLDADGGIRACEYAAARLGSVNKQPVAEAWLGAEFQKLRQSLAAGRLPSAHCEGCVRLCAVGHIGLAPLVRDYGRIGPEDGLRAWSILLPQAGQPLAAGVRQALGSELSGLEHLSLQGADSFGIGAWQEVLALLRAATKPPQVQLRLARVGDPAAAVLALDGLRIQEIEIDLSHGDLAELDAARRLARSLGASLRAIFVFTPARWFEFLDVARGCGQEPTTPLDLRLQGHSAEIPLASVSVDDLAIVRDAFRSAWQELAGPARPDSLREHAFGEVSQQFLFLLQHRAEAAASGGERSDSSIGFPPLDHGWFTDAGQRAWWLRILLGQAHAEPVQRWVAWLLQSKQAEQLLRQHVALRVVCHRVACERMLEPVLAALRKVYADPKRGAELVAQDSAFAAEFDLSPFGGPWSAALGIARVKSRKKPFAIGRPKAARPKPDVTVLIPSYRHEAYVVDAIRSVLAQDYGGIAVLVVDDRSPDGTVEKARSIDDPRVEVRVNEVNLGLGNSVLAALEQVTTPFVALLNSDDLFHPKRIKKCREALIANPKAQLVTTGLFLVDASGDELDCDNVSPVIDGRLVSDWVRWYAQATPPEDLPDDELFPRLLESNFLATSSNLVARTDWLRGQAESLRSLKYCLDWQLFLQAALEGALCHIHEPLAAYRLHATNTVWFREGRRWAYYLEVNRVASASVSRFAQRVGAQDERGVARVLDAVAAHVARNRETDGLAMFVNSAIDALRLEGLAESSESIQLGIQHLNQSAEAIRDALDRAASLPSADDNRRQSWRRLVGELAIEHANVEKGARAWLEGYCESLEVRLRDCWSGRNAIENEKAGVYKQVDELQAVVVRLEQRVERIGELEDEKIRLQEERTELMRQAIRLRADANSLRADAEALRRDRDAGRAELDTTRDDNSALRADLEGVRARREELERELAVAHGQLQASHHEAQRMQAQIQEQRQQAEAQAEVGRELRQRLASLQTDHDSALESLEGLEADHRAASEEIDRLRESWTRESVRARGLESVKSGLEQQRQSLQADLETERARNDGLQRQSDALQSDLAAARDQRAALLAGREYRWGNFFWNKLPFGELSRRGKKWYRKMLDLKNRGSMWLSSLFRRKRTASGTAVVAACWQWPIYSHTFVYQEMLGLTHMGMDLKMFHWDLGDMGQLHKAFNYLKDHRVQLQPVWDNHLRDKEHFDKTRPGRLRAFLELVSKATGKPIDELEKEPIVLQGCTFARMAELAGAKYLHSYFFYDQSFMVMQAAWLLEIPRGVSCYADHMLEDYPWKLVPLQVQLASVVVATSARIKRELSAKSGGKHDDKILVKPNGVDGARFPAFDRPLRKKGEPFEVVSISRVEPKKGLIHLVEAIADLKQRGHDVIAHVVGSKDLHSKGSAEYAEQFDRRIQELGVGDRIVQHGMMKQEDLAPILKKCRAFVAPYVELGSGDKDGIPTAMLEGLASGLPVVTTDSGSILEVVDNGVEGIVVPQRDSKAFAEALLRLVADPELERRMGKAARARFDKDFDIRVTEMRLHERIAALVAKVSARR